MNKAGTKIISMKTGYSNSFLIMNGKSAVLVDTGIHGFMNRFNVFFKRAGVQFSDIGLIILTHTHFDHTGNLIGLQRVTGAKVAIHKNEYLNLKKGFMPVPSGITTATRVISGVGRVLFPRIVSPPPYDAEIVVDSEFDLGPGYGLEGRVIPTPGHTKGSQSVLLGRTLIAGDTFLNIRSDTIFPHFVDDPVQLLKTWQELFKLEIDEIYPAHGAKFSIEKAFGEYEKWSDRLKTNQKLLIKG